MFLARLLSILACLTQPLKLRKCAVWSLACPCGGGCCGKDFGSIALYLKAKAVRIEVNELSEGHSVLSERPCEALLGRHRSACQR